ncbi:histone-lysine N-methyltransferase SETMAR [Trichonephila clavipes]|nr:histone-lysine N-methyltransferase SETMAR [Trichonephila clavipes]
MKHGSNTTRLNQKDRRLSGQELVTAIQSDPKLKHQLGSPDLAPNDHWLFADPKRMLQGKRFDSNEEMIPEAETYFESQNKSFYNKCIKKFKDRWAECITLEGEYLDK